MTFPSPIIAKLQETPLVELTYVFSPGEGGLISINKAYTTFRGKRTLSAAGKALKAKIQMATAQATMKLLEEGLEWRTALLAIYSEGYHVVVLIDLYWTQLHNNSWKLGGSKTAKGAHRSPYQKKDGTNYIKLIEDGVADATGIDDSAHLLVAVMKHASAEERVAITYRIHE